MKSKSQFLLLSVSFFILLIGCSTLKPLSKAAMDGDTKTIKTLLSQGENVNLLDKGRQPLHLAALYGQFEAAKLLIESGADINAKDAIEQTPLMLSTYAGNPGGDAIAKLLISKGADIDAFDYQGWKFIHHAKYAQNPILAGLIVANEAEKTGIDAPGYDPHARTINFDNVIPKIDYSGTRKIMINVIDKREYVLSGKSKPDYVGFIRLHALSLPRDMSISGGKALAEILTDCITKSYKKAGYEVLNKETRVERSLIIYINEWTSDAFYNVGFIYNFVLHVQDENNVLIESIHMSGTDDLGSIQGLPIVRSKLLVPDAAKKRLSELLNDSNVKRALQ